MERVLRVLNFLQTVWKSYRKVLFSWRFAFGLLVVYGLVSPSRNIDLSVVLDEADVLSPAAEADLERDLAAISADLPMRFVVATAGQVAPGKLPAMADAVLPGLDGERSWLSEQFLPNAGNGVLIYYSEQPALVQVRYGRSVWPRARIAGIDYGGGYEELQSLAIGAGGVPDLGGVARAAGTKLEAVGGIPLLRELAMQLIVFIDGSLLQTMLVPDLELWRGFSRQFAGPALEWLGKYVSNPFAFLLVLGCAIPLVRAAVMLIALAPMALTMRMRDPFSGGGCIATLFTFGLAGGSQVALVVLFAWPALGLSWLAASGRAEDLLMLGSLGLDTDRLPQFPHTLGIWSLIGLSALMFLLRGLRALADEESALKRKFRERLERTREIIRDEELLKQQEDQIYVEAADAHIGGARGRRIAALWKGALGAAIVWVVPPWLAIMIASFSLAYELVPIRFGQRK